MFAPTAASRHPTAARRLAGGRGAHVVLFALCALVLLVLWPSWSSSSSRGAAQSGTPIVAGAPAAGHAKELQGVSPAAAAATPEQQQQGKVLLELFVMSQCPDARFCQRAFEPIVARLPSVVHVRTWYIGRQDAPGGPVECMHGESECTGNRLQLCLQQHAPSNAAFYQALLCHSAGSVSDPGQLKSCMAASNVSAEAQARVAACAGGAEGAALQAKSAAETKARGVQRSCTVYVGGKRRCIRDGGTWYSCEGGSAPADFIQTICAAQGDKTPGQEAECRAAAAGGEGGGAASNRA